MSPASRTGVARWGQVGYIANGIALVVVGALLSYAVHRPFEATAGEWAVVVSAGRLPVVRMTSRWVARVIAT
jgi:hypothetical protein